MPIGKDSLKRVTNGGYSKVKSEAPDMENSVVIESAQKSQVPKGDATRTAQSAKKSASAMRGASAGAKSGAAKKSPASAKPKATASESAEATPRSGFCPIGSEMPDFLL